MLFTTITLKELAVTEFVFSQDLMKKGYEMMLRSRFFEDETERLFTEEHLHGTTHLATGQEASQAGLCLALEPEDWITTTHRCHGYTVCKGTDVYRMFAELAGSREGICKGLSGSMHFQDPDVHNAGSSAVVGSGIPLATGIAFSMMRQKHECISVSIFGDGACSRGTLHECLNLASVWNLPELFYCENNLYGMSAASSRMISTSSIASRADGYGICHRTVDGNDLEAVYIACAAARKYIIENHRPFFIEVLTYRQKGHSKNDKRLYRTAAEEELWAKRDPIALLEEKIVSHKAATAEELARTRERIKGEIQEASARAMAQKDNTLSQSEADSLVMAPETYKVPHQESLPGAVNLSYREAIHAALGFAMHSDPNVVLIGEDICLYGGCFKVTGNLYKEYPDQLIETPVSEESFAGLAVGAARTGMRPVVEIMYADFATLISDPVINHAAKSYFMSGGRTSCPLVIRLPEGSGTGHGPQHTQCTEAMFLNTPGLTIVSPSSPKEAFQLLTLSIQSNNPVLFFEHKALYSDTEQFNMSEPMLPIGKARILREGTDITLIASSQSVSVCIKAAAKLQAEGISAEVLDLRTLKPLDSSTILESVKKTGRALIVQCTPLMGSVSSDVESLICSDDEAFRALKSPVKRLGARETPVPFNEILESAYVPRTEDVLDLAISMISGTGKVE